MRSAARVRGAPPKWAATDPVTIRATTTDTIVTGTAIGRGEVRMATSGMSAPRTKAAVDALGGEQPGEVVELVGGVGVELQLLVGQLRLLGVPLAGDRHVLSHRHGQSSGDDGRDPGATNKALVLTAAPASRPAVETMPPRRARCRSHIAGGGGQHGTHRRTLAVPTRTSGQGRGTGPAIGAVMHTCGPARAEATHEGDEP